MSTLEVSIKHAGKTQNIILDTSEPVSSFKQSIYEATGVPVDRMKVMSKGVVLKDDTSWSKLALKSGHQFMIIGAAGDLPKPPEKPIVFLEDMGDADLASALHLPVGLMNLGNTCYMNSTIQCLRAIPELHTALDAYEGSAVGGGQGQLTTEMRRLYQSMRQTTERMIPALFLQRLRTVAPQFAEQRPGQGYAQQDAEECLGSILSSLRGASLAVPAKDTSPAVDLVEKYIMGEMETELKCDESPEEDPTLSTTQFSKLDCNIGINTNYMHTGIKESLDQKIEKQSPSLGRSAVYSQRSRISRLPSNLFVHMVRFYWRRDINKKAKIMRKVKFPFEFDVLDLVTDDLKQKLLPVNTRLKEIEKERHERQKIRKRTHKSNLSSNSAGDRATTAPPAASPTITVGGGSSLVGEAMDVEENQASNEPKERLQDERTTRAREADELLELVHPDLRTDAGTNVTGIYELVALVTHKGASADSGHYIGYARADVIKANQGATSNPEEDHDSWIKFDDDKVTTLNSERVGMLDGGGEESAAYILLYRSKPLS
ncbi:cysteine proteinase [Serendipita vermifera]|nr:cysteine proteinase [Serendipita vermifera]